MESRGGAADGLGCRLAVPWGAVAGAVISAGAGAAENSASSSAAKKAAAPLNKAQDALYSQAESIAATPYTAYDGNQVADLSGNQVKAVQQAGANSGPGSQAASYLTSAGDQAAEIAGNNWDSATASKYMNPYTQNVTDIALRKENQSYHDTQNANDANSAASGAFGGDRAALTKAATSVGHNLNQGDLEAQGNAAAYTNAQQLWAADNARRASAANAYQQAGNDITGMNASQIKDLLATGGADQAVQQMKLSTGYNNYLDKRNWATNQIAPLESAVGRTPTLAATNPTNYASSLVGAGSALAGYFGANSSNNTNNTAALTSSLNNTSEQNTNSLANENFGFDSNASYGAGDSVSIPSTPTIDGYS